MFDVLGTNSFVVVSEWYILEAYGWYVSGKESLWSPLPLEVLLCHFVS